MQYNSSRDVGQSNYLRGLPINLSIILWNTDLAISLKIGLYLMNTRALSRPNRYIHHNRGIERQIERSFNNGFHLAAGNILAACAIYRLVRHNHTRICNHRSLWFIR